MVLDITQMGPQMSLWWALVSLAVGLGIVVLIAVKIWRENRHKKRNTTRNTTPEYRGDRHREEASGGGDNGDAIDDRVQ